MIGRLAISVPVVLAAFAATPAAAHGDPSVRPEPADVEGLLYWQSGSVCRTLIDACLDSDGNEIHPIPEFKVSELKCRLAAISSSVCSFIAVKTFGPGDIRPPERCTATFRRDRSSRPGLTWDFAYHPQERPSFERSPILTCN
ncbi:MAG TPA: hypothetical protein VF650_07515 [Allosphingosinicella sp.]